MNRKKKCFILISIIVLTIGLTTKIVMGSKPKSIEKILKEEAYAYLPKEAREYIQKEYEKTGEIIRTEKNKKADMPYLNPAYIDYLSSSEKDKSGSLPPVTVIDYEGPTEKLNDNIPSKYNLKNVDNKSFVTPNRNQGRLGICWAFASAGVAESHLLKTTNTSYSSNSKLISERQIDYATAVNGLSDYNSEYVSFIDRDLGDGGNFYISTIAMANGISLFDYNDFKSYNDGDLTKMEIKDVLSYNKSSLELNSTTNMPTLNIRASTDNLTDNQLSSRTSFLNQIKSNIMNNGAAFVSTYMSSSCQYQDPTLNNLVIDVYNCTQNDGHAMQIIGWDDDLEYSYCSDNNKHTTVTSSCNNVVHGKGVWILKNSWGTTNTPNPYLAYDSAKSNISFITNVTNTNNKTWDNNYIIGDGSVATSSHEYLLSDTKIRNDETVKKVKFLTNALNKTYTVEITKKDGTKKTLNKTVANPGLVTFDIDDAVVDSNSKIKITSTGYFIDRVMIFTSNVDKTPYINLEKYNNTSISETELRFYSDTKNIPSGSTLVYKLYDENNNDVSNKITVTNNVVAENNINTKIRFLSTLSNGDYVLKVLYNNNVVNSINIDTKKMTGAGTASNPYVITNPTQLYQIREHLDAYYILGNDIDLTEATHEGGRLSKKSEACSQGFGWEAINNFSGTLDGKGYTVRGLYQNNYLKCDNGQTKEWANNNNGLFNSVTKNATIKNINIEDFDITCQGSYCGALVSKYMSSVNESGSTNYADTTEYSALFQNITIKNSKINGIENGSNPNSSYRYTYGGGLFGSAESLYGNITFSNIYIDIKTEGKFIETSKLVHYISGKNVDINNIQLTGNIIGRVDSGENTAILNNSMFAQDNNNVSIKNVLSTINGEKIGSHLLGTVWGDANYLTIKGVNGLKIADKDMAYRFDNQMNANISGTNFYDPTSQLIELTKNSNYSTWENINNYWNLGPVNGIARIPVLKIANFEYTSIPDITLMQQLNKKVNIYDYVTPKTEDAKRISYKSNDENIVKLDEKGNIIPVSSGNTTIHVESLYDGYIKDVPIDVEYLPHYTINFDANSGTGKMNSIEVATNTNYVLPANEFTKEYYEFKGWNTAADGTGTSYNNLSQIPAMNDKESITLYAQWIGEEIDITFDANGGTVTPNKKTIRYGENYGNLPIPTRPGYAFTGWYVENNGGRISVDADTRIFGNNLIAGWRENAYTIIYDANGGNLKNNYSNPNNLEFMSNTVAITIALNNSTTQLSDVLYEKEGYTFKEWNTKSDGTGASYSAEETIQLTNVENDALRLYAIWKSNQGTITYNSNNGLSQTKTQNITYDVDLKLNKNTFTKEGYTFKEWNTKSDGTGTSYRDEQIVNIGNNLTLYAQWEINKYTITFNSNDGTNNRKTQSLIHNTVTKLNKNTFTREGYTFKEWNTKADGTGTSYQDESQISINSNLNLYAKWQLNKYKVVFNTNGGNKIEDQTVDINTKVTKPQNPTKSGYTFIGWYKDTNLTAVFNFSDKITKDTTIYAKWEKQQTIANGVYTISSALNNNYVLDLKGKVQNSSNIQLYKSNNSAAQKWQVTYLKDGYYKITIASNNNYALNVYGGKKVNGTNVQLYKYKVDPSVHWIIKDVGGGYYNIISKSNNLALEINGGKVKNGANIDVWQNKNANNQKFKFTKVTTSSPAKQTIANGVYKISSALNNNYVLDLKGSLQNSSNIQLYKSNNTAAQKWQVTYIKDGYYKITIASNNNYALNVYGGKKVNGTNVQLYKYKVDPSVHWIIKDVGGGYYNIISKSNNLALEIHGGKVKNGANIDVWQNKNANNQKFKFTKTN